MRRLLVGSVILLGVSVGAVPADASTTTLFSSSTPGVAGSPPVVPATICAVTITAEGGRGGMYDGFTDVPGGAGASVTARIAVSPGATLNVLVGGAGGTGGGDEGGLTGDGGNGGGGGGGYGAAGGGGVSAVWTSANVPLVVAGAGGGSNPAYPGGAGGLLGQPGGDGGTNGVGGVGPRSGKGGKADGTGGAGGGGSLDYAGGGGGGVGTGGAAGDNSPPNRDGGPGGTGNGTVGGAGGSGGGSGSNGTAGGVPPGSGNAGTSSFFGDGGAGVAPGGNGGTAPTTASAGGGGGVGFGGGGGAGSGPAGGSAGGGAGYGAGGGASGDGGGGGGGGSSYVTPSALSSSSAASTRSGDGQVTITYDPVADACPDTTDPTVDLRTPPEGATYSRNQAVTADFDCADERSLASCVGTVADGAAVSTSSLGSHSFTVTATDTAGNDLVVTHHYTVVDATDPTVDLQAPLEGAVFAHDELVGAAYSCADEVGGSGLASCVGTVADGAGLDTATAGDHAFTVTATDVAGNDLAVTHHYTVVDGRPDGRIRKGTAGALAGDGVYNTTGASQTRSGAAARGRNVTYVVSLQNDAPFADALRLRGTASSTRFGVRYLQGSTDITAAVTAGTYATPTLDPGATVSVKVVVTVRNAAPAHASSAGTLTARSSASPTVRDTVRFVTSRA